MLYTVTTDVPVLDPTSGAGTAHGVFDVARSRGERASTVRGPLLEPRELTPLVSCHPKMSPAHGWSDSIASYLRLGHGVTVLYPSLGDLPGCINNYWSKIWDPEDPFAGALQHTSIAELWSNYPEYAGVEWPALPTWVRREFISYKLIDAYCDQLDWYWPAGDIPAGVNLITTEQLLNDPAGVLDRTIQHHRLELTKPPEVLWPAWRMWLTQQTSLAENQIAASWLAGEGSTEPSLITQAYIQHQLRSSGKDIACVGLDEWPTHSAALVDKLVDNHL